MHTTQFTKIEASPDGKTVTLHDSGVWTQLITSQQPCSIASPEHILRKPHKAPRIVHFDPLNCVEVHVGAESFVAVGAAQ